VEQQPGEFDAKDLCVGGRRKIVVFRSGCDVTADDPVDQLLEAGLAAGRVECSAEVLGGDDR